MTTQQDPDLPNIVRQAIDAAGGVPVVRDALKLGATTAYYWINTGRVPAHQVIPLCRLTGGLFQPHQLRPERFSASVRV